MFALPKIFVALAATAVLIATGLIVFSRTSQSYETATVTRGAIAQVVLASGTVESPSASDMRFKSAGRLVAVRTEVGQKVSAGSILALQDTSLLEAQLQEAQAVVASARAALQKIKDGATPETVAVSEADLNVARQTLRNYYASVSTTITEAYNKANDAVVNQLAPFFSNAQSISPSLSFNTNDQVLALRLVSERAKATVELAAWRERNLSLTSADDRTLEQAITETQTRLSLITSLLNDAVGALAGNINLTPTEATAYRSYTAAGLTEINAASAALQALRQNIDSAKVSVAAKEAALRLTKAGATLNDISAQESLVLQSEAKVAAIRAQIRDLEIIAPFSGTVTRLNGEPGENITPDVIAVSLMPETSLDIEVNISEDNIVGVKSGDKVRIELDAFPSGADFFGTIRAVDPAETVLGGAVYYRATIAFDGVYEGIRSGMTANVWIETASTSNTLMVPASAIVEKGGEFTARVLENGSPHERALKIGIRGDKGMVEVLSGLSENERVVVGEKP